MMKSLFYIALVVVFFYSCEEVGPPINLKENPVDTTLVDTSFIDDHSATPDQKNVLIEDFTGVNCPNCPKAAAKIDELKTQYPGRIVAVSIHPDGFSFTEPFPGHRDFRTEEGTNLYKLLGQSPGLPAGDVDRIKYTGEERMLINFNSWPSYVDQQLQLNTPVNIHLTINYNADSSDYAHVFARIQYTEDVQEKHFLSIFLLESDMEDWQIYPFGVIDSHYVHNHVFREPLTSYNGDLLMENPEKDRVFIKEYKVKIRDDWESSNCSFIAFIHRRGLDDFAVIHAVEKHF